MHETNSKNYSGHVDSINYNKDNTEISGWVAYNNKDEPINSFSILDKTKNKELDINIEKIERKDVYDSYNKQSEKYLYSGFKFQLPTTIRKASLTINDEEVFDFTLNNIKGLSPNKVMKKNKDSYPDIIVVDDFYDDPDTVREYALQQDFFEEKEYFKGKRTKEGFGADWIKEEFEKLLGKKVKEFVGPNGVFQHCTSHDPVVYHYDIQEYAAIVYLSPDAPPETGTDTYKSKITGMRRAAKPEDEEKFGMDFGSIDYQSFNGNKFLDKTNMEMIDSIGNVYNRLIIFNARLIHGATGYFGDTKENSRLFQIFFFNCE